MPRRPEFPGDVAATSRVRDGSLLVGAATVLGFALGYVGLAQLSAWLSGAADVVPFWPLSGVMLGVALALPRGRAVALLVAGAVANVVFDVGVLGRPSGPAVVSGVVAFGEALFAAAALRAVRVSPRLVRSLRDFGWFLLLSGLVLPWIGAFVAAEATGARTTERAWWEAFLSWGIGDGLGMLLVAPIVTALLGDGPRWPPGRRAEGLLGVAVTAGAAWVLLGPPWRHLPTVLQYPYWMSPVLLWVALRAGSCGVLWANLVLAVVTVATSARGHGPFGRDGVDGVDRTLLVETYVGLSVVLTHGASILLSRVERLASRLGDRRRALAVAERAARLGRERLEVVLDGMAEAVLGVDLAGEPTFSNAAARRLLTEPGETELPPTAAWLARTELLTPDGRPLAQADLPVPRALRGEAVDRARIVHRPRAGGPSVQLEVTARPLHGADGRVRGAVAVFTDVTALAASEASRARLDEQLRRTASELQALRGILPICGYCHRIRDEAGGWTPLEAFVSARSQASFSHGVCPDCLQRVLRRPGGTSPATP